MNLLNNKLLIIDGTWLIRRQFHVCNKSVDEKTNEPNPNIVIKSFFRSLLKYIKDYNYEHRVVVAFDRGTYRYRPKTEYTEYKETRNYDDSYEVLWEANNKIIPILRNLGFVVIQIGGLEADDIAGYYSNFVKQESIMISSDKDWILNITKNCSLFLANSKKVKCEKDVMEEFGSVELATYAKAFFGDSSDNIKGISTNKELCEKVVNDWHNRHNYLSSDDLKKIDRNYDLVRLDKIRNDNDAIEIIRKQETFTKVPNSIQLFSILSEIDYDPYFTGVISKYNKGWK